MSENNIEQDVQFFPKLRFGNPKKGKYFCKGHGISHDEKGCYYCEVDDKEDGTTKKSS